MSRRGQVAATAASGILGLCVSALPVASAEETTLIPRDTIIPVLVTKEVRVGGAGDSQTKKVVFEVAQDVIINHHIIAKKGDTTEGHITTAKNTTKRILSSTTSSEVALSIDDVVNFCGDTIHMKFERTLVGGSHEGWLTMGSHAHDAVFDKGIVLKSKTDRVEKKICTERSSQENSTVPEGMMVPDEEVISNK